LIGELQIRCSHVEGVNMNRITSVLGMLAAAVAALLVVPLGTANAAPAAVKAGDAQISLVNDYQTVSVKLHNSVFRQQGDSLAIVNSLGKTTDRIPLVVKSEGKSVPVSARVAADRKSAELTPHFTKTQVAKHNVKGMTKAQAYNDLVNKANKNFNCALPAIAVGAIIGFFVFFVGWVIGGLIGAYIGYSNCGGGETIRAGQRWLSAP